MKRIIMIIAATLLTCSMLASCVSEAVPTPTEVTATPQATPAPQTSPVPETTPATEVTPTPTTTPTPEKADPHVVLKDKVAYFYGDSICAASVYDGAGSRHGWAKRIVDTYGMNSKLYKNSGIDGASVSNCRGENTVYNQVIKNRMPMVDYVILEGGVNDAWDSWAVGTMVEATPEETDIDALDLGTFAGGLEKLLYQCKKQYPYANIGYIICFKLNHPAGKLNDMTEYVEMTKKICDKWGVPYLNLYEDDEFNAKFEIKTLKNAVDGCHPNENGYDLLAPVIAQFMADITK